jgi:hypothetical protein
MNDWQDLLWQCQDLGVCGVDALDLLEHDMLFVDTWQLGTLIFFGVPTVRELREALRKVWLRSLN